MRISFRQPKQRKLITTVILACIVVMSVMSALLITTSHDKSSVGYLENTGPERTRIPTVPFRFPDENQQRDKNNPGWQIQGSVMQGQKSPEMVLGFHKHRILHFTFDDGPDDVTTSRLLDLLSSYNIHATFFVVGQNLYGPDAKVRRDLIRRMGRDGHTISVHSYTHKDFRTLSDLQIDRELYRTERLLETILGYRPGLFRSPFGGRNKRTISLLKTHGYTEILWNIAPEEFGAHTPQEILYNFWAALDHQEQHNHGPGGIVLLHDNRPTTVLAFPLIMEELRRRNCLFVRQGGQELWDVVGDLGYFLRYGDDLPSDLITQRQTRARHAASRYCSNAEAD